MMPGPLDLSDLFRKKECANFAWSLANLMFAPASATVAEPPNCRSMNSILNGLVVSLLLLPLFQVERHIRLKTHIFGGSLWFNAGCYRFTLPRFLVLQKTEVHGPCLGALSNRFVTDGVGAEVKSSKSSMTWYQKKYLSRPSKIQKSTTKTQEKASKWTIRLDIFFVTKNQSFLPKIPEKKLNNQSPTAGKPDVRPQEWQHSKLDQHGMRVPTFCRTPPFGVGWYVGFYMMHIYNRNHK